MKMMKWLFVSVLVIGSCAAALGQAAKADEPKTVTQVLDGGVSTVEGEFTSAAEAMPEDKYSFAPTVGEFKGVRNFAQQVKHVAAVNYVVGAAILGEKPPIAGGENGPDTVTSKADIVKFLKDSFAYAHKATASVNEKNMVESITSPFGEGKVTRLGMATVFAWHGFDHYGQIVEYLRMNGIIPPASRQ